MRHQRRRGKLGLEAEHRKALLKNLVKSLVLRKSIKTTFGKAKAASSLADKMVQLAKRGDLHARRQLISKLGCEDTAAMLIKDIAPQFKERQGGYTRVLKLGARVGDAAEMALLEFTETFDMPKKRTKVKKEIKSEAIEVASKKSEKKSEKKKEDLTSSEKKAEKSDEQSKETDKRGGFLGTLRKFLKGDENK